VNTKQLLELAERCEREEPSRELSVEIYYAITPARLRSPLWTGDFTTSLDAAVTLVPEGWVWAVSQDAAAVGPPDSSYIGDELAMPCACEGKTPALALCAAALKARAAVAEQTEASTKRGDSELPHPMTPRDTAQ